MTLYSRDMNTTWITADSTTDQRLATDAEMTYLEQVIDIDGRDAVVLAEEDVTNGSGRVVGTHLTVDADAWEFVQEALRRDAR